MLAIGKQKSHQQYVHIYEDNSWAGENSYGLSSTTKYLRTYPPWHYDNFLEQHKEHTSVDIPHNTTQILTEPSNIGRSPTTDM